MTARKEDLAELDVNKVIETALEKQLQSFSNDNRPADLSDWCASDRYVQINEHATRYLRMIYEMVPTIDDGEKTKKECLIRMGTLCQSNVFPFRD